MRRARRLHPILVVAAVLLAYHESLTVPFLFDDVEIGRTPAVRELSWDTIQGTTRPLVRLSLALNYAYGGESVRGYHLVNLAVHILGALTLLGIVRRTFANGRVGTRWRDAGPELALAIALVWAVHPLQTQSVTYVVQRAESLMGLFHLLTLYCVVRAAGSVRPSAWLGGAFVACALGMLTKPVMVTAPVIVFLYDRVFLAGGWRDALRRRWALYGGLAATWLLLAALLAGGEHESATSSGFAMPDVTVSQFASSQPRVILHYLALAFWPHGLVLDYAWRAADAARTLAPSILVLVALLVWPCWRFRAYPPVTLLVASFAIALLPSSSVVPIRDIAMEHRMYLALAPVIALVVIGAWACIHSSALRAAAARRVALGVAVATIVTLGTLTFWRNRDYRSGIAMWTDVAAKRPLNARAHGNLGQALFDAGRTDEAMASLGTAIRLQPDYAEARNNLGVALMARGRFDEAAAQYDESLRLDPDRVETHNNLGNLHARRGNLSGAVGRYQQALALDPGYAMIHYNLALALARQGNRGEAVRHAAEALRLRPDLDAVFRPSGLLAAR